MIESPSVDIAVNEVFNVHIFHLVMSMGTVFQSFIFRSIIAAEIWKLRQNVLPHIFFVQGELRYK